MSLRGQRLFDNYVNSDLNNSALAGLGMGSHVFNLTSAAGAAHIPVAEVIEEVGALFQALVAARKARL